MNNTPIPIVENKWYYLMDEQGETPMSRATKSGQDSLTDVFRRIHESKAPEGKGASELHRAAYWGLETAVQKLLASGANPNLLDDEGETPLFKAVRLGHREAALALLSSGASPNMVDRNGLSTLHWVALNGRVDLAELLLENGADVNVRHAASDGVTPLGLAKMMGYEDVAEVLGAKGGHY